MNELIGIIVPVYKVEKYIHRCIDSILKQTYDNFILILVDDGSPDDCPLICDYYARKDSRIRVIHKSNGGLTSAWMEGLKQIPEACEYITFVDSDDWIGPNYLQDFVNKMQEYDADVVIGNTSKFSENDTLYVSSGHVGLYDKRRLEDEIYPRILFNGSFHGRAYPVSRWGKLYKKYLLTNNVKYCSSGTSYGEDLNITFPVMLDADRVYFLEKDKGIYNYMLNPESMLHSYDRTMLSSIMHVFPMLIQVCIEKDKESLIQQVIADSLAASVQYYKNELLNPKGLKETKKSISQYSHNALLKRAIEEINWKHFRKLNVIIICSYRNYNWFYKDIVTPLLRMLKKSGLRKPS